ncbi:quinol:cytochrome C oxidoreductase [Sphingobacterium alkalisoli]|uniref:Quinol:cytochrome C oxidoreductase n=1 Tax=Sphingobacterium alkalisoli TaxID=1874115 RepID=A0A4U0H9H3_9SPHI|nr:quinol:cytochrome C oxidoreductase [Sphingobacterium alkalisoli]TJY68537.1 quinol:cytochrome C oxidoreductase [Sphingobacterium alkalisoli]GGH05823.1 quinol:cytochrome C oxidoreductase [Sphingobacterium alkalisoli]
MGTHSHHHDYNFSEQYKFAGTAKVLSLVAIVVGIVAVALGLLSSDHIMVERTYANLLLMGYYFTCVCAAGAFFVALQLVTQSGWSAGLIRIPQAMASILPIASVILFIIIALGLSTHNLYHHWHAEGLTDPNSPNYDALVAGKASYLNMPWFLGRQIIFMGLYSVFAVILAKLSYNEDLVGGLNSYKQSFKLSAIFLVIFGFTTPIWSFDTIMSLEAHWFSTMFGWYNFAAMWVSGLCVITLILIFLKKAGYMSWVNENHLHDLGKLIFGFSIFWTYVWFAQFMLIWYANIPEETVYFYKRWEPEYKPWFWINIIINFVAPLLLLVDRDAKRRLNVMMCVCILLLLGHWLDYYIMVMPGTVETHRGFGYIEVGTAIGFMGIFIFLVMSKLSRHPLAAKNHPFLDESLHHQI